MTDAAYQAEFDQRLARMRETARLAAAFYKGLIAEGLDQMSAVQITAVYSVTINDQPSDDNEPAF